MLEKLFTKAQSFAKYFEDEILLSQLREIETLGLIKDFVNLATITSEYKAVSEDLIVRVENGSMENFSHYGWLENIVEDTLFEGR